MLRGTELENVRLTSSRFRKCKAVEGSWINVSFANCTITAVSFYNVKLRDVHSHNVDFLHVRIHVLGRSERSRFCWRNQMISKAHITLESLKPNVILRVNLTSLMLSRIVRSTPRAGMVAVSEPPLEGNPSSFGDLADSPKRLTHVVLASRKETGLLYLSKDAFKGLVLSLCGTEPVRMDDVEINHRDCRDVSRASSSEHAPIWTVALYCETQEIDTHTSRQKLIG